MVSQREREREREKEREREREREREEERRGPLIIENKGKDKQKTKKLCSTYKCNNEQKIHMYKDANASLCEFSFVCV